MAKSGSINYTQSAEALIDDAYRILGIISTYDNTNSLDEAFAISILNKMIKGWSGKGITMWSVEEAALILDNDVVKYNFADRQGAGGAAGVGVRASSLIQTTLGAAEAAAQTVLTVTSSAGMSASDKILIELTNGDRHDTTIVSVDDATTITITDALPTAAASGNYIYVYTPATDEIYHPRSIMNVRHRNEDGTETPMRCLSRQEYMELAQKTQEGRPYAYYFDKIEASGDIPASNPVMYVYSEPDSLREHIRFDVVKMIDDIDTKTDTFYFPDEWLEAITYNLAVRLAPAYGKEAKLPILVPLAKDFLDDATRSDMDDAAVSFQPGRRL